MKVIKKITAIMLSIMMVLGMCSVVNAAGTTEKGTITISNAIEGQEYKIYKILDLESYDKADDKNLYSYKPAVGWENFFDAEQPGNAYATVNKDGYVEWKGEATEARAGELAQKALAYATKEGSGIKVAGTKTATTTTTVAFDNLDLGYYLVDSSLGTLCGLNTTNPTVDIQEKNDEPSVKKEVGLTGVTYAESVDANIGDEINFQITIDVKKGAHNYKLIDTMENGFQLKNPMNEITTGALQVYATPEDGTFMDTLTEDTDYTFTKDTNGFTVAFENDYLKKHEAVEYKIVVTYVAILTGDAQIGKTEGNKNTAKLTYGDKNKESTPSKTTTYTFEIPVFKYTGTNTPLAGAKFSLYSAKDCADANRINLFKVDGAETYRKFITGKDTGTAVTEITTTDTGKFNITGLKSGTYYLKETKEPEGYNLLKDPIAITIAVDGKITINGGKVTQVEVKNNAGSLLPSTGGVGTTIFYIAGAFLVLISGVVLIAKKRTDAK